MLAVKRGNRQTSILGKNKIGIYAAAILVLLVMILLVSSNMVTPYVASNHSVSISTEQIVLTTQHVVSPDQIVSGGPPPDGIPSIDHPSFLAANEANFLSNSDMVIGIYLNGEAKAYPLLIMVWHEIVNDVVGGRPIAITYCPLCYSTEAYVREIDGRAVTFGTSGKLYNNNLVMYDRLTRSLWSEIWGEAIAGNLTGHGLERVPIDVTPWSVWKELYPHTLVLSENTGFVRAYGADPYGDYYTKPGIYFPLNHRDTRLPVKTVVLGLSSNGLQKAYPLDSFTEKGKIIKDSLGTGKIVFFTFANHVARAYSPTLDGRELHFHYLNGNFMDDETGSIWSYDGVATSGPMQGKSLQRLTTGEMFWFAWAAFYPDTGIYTTP